ncbi:MAG: ABC transporter permease subunit [Gemmatimonas sp.]|nr:ABC transporter permease subunit [Gemmatimonas sp.]
MQAYIARRLLLMIPSLIGVTVIVFLAARLAPVSTVNVILGETGIRDEAIAAEVSERLGLNSSLITQYTNWVWGMIRGDFGESWFTGTSVGGELARRLPVSLELGALALLLSVVVAIPIGALSAIRQDTWLDYASRGSAIFLLSIPTFWIGILVVGLGYYFFTWAPPAEYKSIIEDPSAHIRLMFWPVVVLGINLAGTKMRLVRSSLLEVLRQDYVRTARGKGLNERTVIFQHAMRNALIPVVTVIGLQLPLVVAGSVVLESIFLVPGIGRYAVEASTRYDFPVMQAIVVLVAFAIMISNLVIDISYALLDPRIRYN